VHPQFFSLFQNRFSNLYIYGRPHLFVLKPWQILLLTTDGVFEAHNKNGDMFGRGRIKEVIRQNADLTAKGIRTAITAAVDAFRGATPQEDDITLVVLKFL